MGFSSELSSGSLDADKLNSNELHFFDRDADWVSATLSKIYSLASTFQGFPSDLLLSIKILRYFKKAYFQEKPVGCGC